MRLVGPAACIGLLGLVFAGCATGTSADDSSTIDSGTKQDSSLPKDSSAPKDSTPPKDTGTPPVDSGSGNCGGQCLGLASTCCNNTCVDITSDQNNCGGCGTTCGTQSCCAGNCVDTMGSDNSNCGACGVTCTGTCMNGTCQTQGGSCTKDLGSCSHSPCVVGAALTAGCDPNQDVLFECVYLDPTCCSSGWSQTCVDDITQLLGEDCSGC